MNILRQPLGLIAIAVALTAGMAATSPPAQARVWIGFGFPIYAGPPAYYPPAYYPPPYYPSPYYYPPPGYYAPPAYAPPPAYSRPYAQSSGQSCMAGGTVCPMEHPVASGSSCYCTTGQGRMWGRAS